MKKPLLATTIAVVCALSSQAQIILTTFNSPYSQDFDSLASSGASSTLPTGWALSEVGSNANNTYDASDGGGITGGAKSFGTVSSSERAFGGFPSPSSIPTIGAQFQNNTGGTINELNINYRGEEWHLGVETGSDRQDFQYSLDATSLTTGTWTDFNALDFTTPNLAPPNGAKDGNAAGNFSNLASSILALEIPNGSTFWIRWVEFDVAYNESGLAVDDFSLTAVPEPHEYALMVGLMLLGFTFCHRIVRVQSSR